MSMGIYAFNTSLTFDEVILKKLMRLFIILKEW